MELDSVDLQILQCLYDDSRIPVSKIANILKIKANHVKNRISQMEKAGIIEEYTSVLKPEDMGLKKMCLLRIEGKQMENEPSTRTLLKSLLNEVLIFSF